MDDISFENIGLCYTAKAKHPLKQAHRISGVSFVVLDESHVQGLLIGDDTWFEEISVEDGILLKIRRNVF